MQKSLFAISACAIAAAAAGAGRAQPAPVQTEATVPQAQAPAEQVNIQDIVVTASRREEKLRDVPAAVTAITGDTLSTIGANDFKDYVSLVPGLGQADLGNPGAGTIILRGLYTGFDQATNTTATYIDDAPFSGSGFQSTAGLITPDLDIADLDRIEVLKGPQGTLYGANSLGGIFRIISKKPDVNLESGSIAAEGSTIDGGGSGGLARASLNEPIIPGELAVRVNGVYRVDPGWVTNIGTGKRDVNRSVIEGGRAAVRWTPNADLTVDLNAIYQNITNHGSAYQDNALGTITPLYGRDKYRSNLDLGGFSTYRLISGTASYDVGFGSVIGTVSEGSYHFEEAVDAREYLGLLGLQAPALAATLPAKATAEEVAAPKLDKFTTEARLVSRRLGPVEFVTGFFYTNEQNNSRADAFILGANGKSIPSRFAALILTDTISNYNEVAGFGDATFYATDDFDATGGVRYAHNAQYVRIESPSIFYAPMPTETARFEDDVATYLATVRWRPTEEVSLYARAASGYRPGGPQTNPLAPAGVPNRIQADNVWSYEAGAKGTVLDGKLTFDADVYHIEWTRIQLNSRFGGISLETNGGNAQVTGTEASVTARPLPDVNLTANLGYTDTRITEVAEGVSAYRGVAVGNGLPLVPKWTLAVLGDKTFPLGPDWTGDLGGTVRYRSSEPNNFPEATINPNVRIPSLTTLDLRLSATHDRYTVQFRAENVTNSGGFTNVAAGNLFAGQPGVPSTGVVIRPRTFTLGVSAMF